MYLRQGLSGDLSIRDFFALRKLNRSFKSLHPDYFDPDGSICFCGAQGSGKTLSAVRYVEYLHRIYPKALVVSNIGLTFCDYLPYQGFSDNRQNDYPYALMNLNNGEFGVIVLIDEVQTEFSSLDSSKLSPSVINIICQQRKRRFHLVLTSQLFTRIAKAYREQISAAVDCSCLFKTVQRLQVIDFARCAYDIEGNLTNVAYSKQYFWTRKPAYFDLYDTSEIVSRVANIDVQRR